MQASRFIKVLALILFFLFPLLSIVQLRDTDAPWRRVAEDIRPSVLTLTPDNGSEAQCGLVIQTRPLRVATAGALTDVRTTSVIDGVTVPWSPVFVDPQERFTILQADTDLRGETLGAGSLAHTLPAARLDLEGAEAGPQDVKAALVGPRQLNVESLWVGVLRAEPTTDEAALYRAHLLRSVSEVASVATSDAWAADPGQIDARLRGAPFVDEEGQVVALVLDRDQHRVRALPIEHISRSLVFLHLQAAQSAH